MSSNKWVPVYCSDAMDASMVKSYIEGDDIQVKMVADVKSAPAARVGEHDVMSRYADQILLVREQDEERALELIEDFLSESN